MQEIKKVFITQNSTRHRHKAQCEDEHIAQLSALSWWTVQDHTSPQNCTKKINRELVKLELEPQKKNR